MRLNFKASTLGVGASSLKNLKEFPAKNERLASFVPKISWIFGTVFRSERKHNIRFVPSKRYKEVLRQ